MKSNQSVLIPACCAAFFLAAIQQARAGDGASLVSQTILTNAVMAPGQTFTQTWTIQNTGSTTWSATANGYTLNMQGTDSLGAVTLFARSSAVHRPCGVIGSGSSIAPGATATFSIAFIAPETAGTYSDTFQMNSASSAWFGPMVGVQIVVQQSGPSGQFDRAKAVSYANNYAGYVCSDGYFWTNSSGFGSYGTGVFTPVPTSPIGDDCAHFSSCCIGSESHQSGGGLYIYTRYITYGEPGAAHLINTCLIAAGLAQEVSSLSSLSPGDVIGWNWSGDTNINNIDHDTIYVGNGLIAAHSASHLDVSATTYYQGSYPSLAWHLIHILNKADTIPPTLAISSPTSGQTFTSSTVAVSGTASDAGCPSSGLSLVQVQVNGTGGTWQTASGTATWSTSATLNPGANTIYVRSRDVAGNYSAIASVSVTSDTQGPALAITSPASNAIVTSASLPIGGTASDSGCGNNGVSLVTVNGAGATGGTASGTGTANWNATITLDPGTNLVTVMAKDTLNNSTQKQLTVTYNPPPPLFTGSCANGAGLQTALCGLSAGERVVLEASSDLRTWTPIQTNIVSDSTAWFTNAINPALPSQFLRARVR